MGEPGASTGTVWEAVEQLRDGELRHALTELDKEREGAYHKSLIAGIAALLTVLAILAMQAQPIGMPIFMGFAVVMGVLVIVTAWMAYSETQAYKKRFKGEVIRRLVKFCGPDLHYSPSAGISREQFNDSGLYEKPDEYHAEDLIEGRVGATHLALSEVHAKSVSYDHKGRRQEHTIVRGLCFVVDFPKAFRGRTYVFNDLARHGIKLTGWLTGMPPRTPLDSPEFEEAFEVYSSDQVEARYLLSTSFMERLLAYRGRTSRGLRCSFVGEHFHMVVPMANNLFEPPFMRSCLDQGLLQEYYRDLHLALSLVEDLNLNLRIWGDKAMDALAYEQQTTR